MDILSTLDIFADRSGLVGLSGNIVLSYANFSTLQCFNSLECWLLGLVNPSYLILKTFFRFINVGWSGADSIDMLGVWSRLPPEEIARVTQIEMLDEQELLHQLFSHYCITTAWTDSRWSEIQL